MRVARAVAARERIGPVAAQRALYSRHPSAGFASKRAPCQTGMPAFSDDFDGKVDYLADAKCKNGRDYGECTDPPCGPGADLVLTLPILAALRRRRLYS
jgi:hypothetical protein